jgi:hypothetical protein
MIFVEFNGNSLRDIASKKLGFALVSREDEYVMELEETQGLFVLFA